MNVRHVIFCLSALVISSCASKKTVVKPKKKQTITVVEDEPKKLPSVKEKKHVEELKDKKENHNKYTLEYIQRFAPIAVRKMHVHKIPASITLAQGVLESGSGRSVLALKSNNHFGIKCHTNWTGESVTHDDDEKGECFRKYQYPETSYDDHAAFLTQRKRYAFLFSFKTEDYKKWARGLKDAGYATDVNYPEKIIKIIEDYELYEFDKIKKDDPKYAISNIKYEEIIKKETTYEVKKGDTLYSISKRFAISLDELKKRNNLKDDIISLGQKLIIQ
ncbi:MAG: LysM peptidoglycan-binding domain-containing protein [Flavobacteriia bacterium]|nr:LysM peptidoglycan-binding domain-containing protein [Flavobacteriia bacterium]OIP48125.1 MAG: N-acetylmuramidase [Flavobacteriaceae bacterium CG2_30_31_66]PIV97833.1 MAG: N-acetylmuramidase [Flavobacteriaceae bacterium CG17_big_fil_post_rev_8_21_14_2_50_31_13]PIX13058.1 MAG: N-acetylmuramidase [Flavobacteriaceae bacterium CG_4_8_14_3_um_filter_31_8]PIY14574.1 MAG: N-acetylmuramidase [Flavobacteriaceae bacterium CG_4_10_14_3_um_filter_31_253]PIZ10842.1 MAG: N-acetylmuramidase [Flavobacteria